MMQKNNQLKIEFDQDHPIISLIQPPKQFHPKATIVHWPKVMQRLFDQTGCTVGLNYPRYQVYDGHVKLIKSGKMPKSKPEVVKADRMINAFDLNSLMSKLKEMPEMNESQAVSQPVEHADIESMIGSVNAASASTSIDQSSSSSLGSQTDFFQQGDVNQIGDSATNDRIDSQPLLPIDKYQSQMKSDVDQTLLQLNQGLATSSEVEQDADHAAPLVESSKARVVNEPSLETTPIQSTEIDDPDEFDDEADLKSLQAEEEDGLDDFDDQVRIEYYDHIDQLREQLDDFRAHSKQNLKQAQQKYQIKKQHLKDQYHQKVQSAEEPWQIVKSFAKRKLSVWRDGGTLDDHFDDLMKLRQKLKTAQDDYQLQLQNLQDDYQTQLQQLQYQYQQELLKASQYENDVLDQILDLKTKLTQLDA